MALMTCPECNRDMSNTLNACPHCGFRIKKTNNTAHKEINQSQTHNINPAKTTASTKFAGLTLTPIKLFIIIISITAIITTALFISRSYNPSSNDIFNIFQKVYKVGDRGPAGGWIFFDKGSYEGGWRYLEAAPEDQSTSAEWGCKGKSINNAQATAIGTGYNNTQFIIKSCDQPDIAAKICVAYRGGGKNDWYLPSNDEVYLMGKILNELNVSLNEPFYWSSSEAHDNGTGVLPKHFACIVNKFEARKGVQKYLGYYSKNEIKAVRAIRRF